MSEGTYQIVLEDGAPVIQLTPDGGGSPLRLLLLGDTAHVTAADVTSGPNILQGQSGQTAAAAIRATLGILLIVLMAIFTGCASDDGMGGMGTAANRATGGDASGKSGGIDSKLVGGYMPGDIDSWDVKAQRNTTASAAGSSYSIGTVAAGSGAEAMQKAIAADPVVIEIKAAIDAEKALGERASSERLATLRGELVARINSIADQAGKAAPQITVTGNTMVVVAPSNTGVTPPPISPEDAKAAAEIQGIIGAARSQSPPTSQPTKD
mgnify:FL=1